VAERLRQKHGTDTAAWAWGRIHPLTLGHPFAQKKLFRRIFNLGPFPCGGDPNTINQATGVSLGQRADHGYIASLRMVADVGDWPQSRLVLPGGQSGNPLSPHYADQLPLWQRGEGIPIPWTDDQVRQATRETLVLEPAKRSTS